MRTGESREDKESLAIPNSPSELRSTHRPASLTLGLLSSHQSREINLQLPLIASCHYPESPEATFLP